MSYKYFFLCLLLPVCFYSCRTSSIKLSNGTTLKREKLESFIIAQMDSLKVPGLSIAIIQEGKIIYENVFGVKNYETGEPVVNETIFEAASLSKPVFAYFVLKLAEKGVIDLNKPLSHYYPHPDISDTAKGNLITARMVLCHTSGLPNSREKENVGELPVLFTPGSKYEYSGEGYQYLKDVLCHILKLNDTQLDSLFQREVVKPIGAKNMGFTWQNHFTKLKAYGHLDGIPTDNKSQGPETYFGSAGGLHCNAVDYARFLLALLQKDNSESEIIEEMFAVRENMPVAEGELPRALAFERKQIGNRIRFWHGGKNRDTRAYCHLYRKEKEGLVMFSNCDTFQKTYCAKRIMEYMGMEWNIK